MAVEPRGPDGSMLSTSTLFHFDLIGVRRSVMQRRILSFLFVSFRFVSLIELNK